MMQCVHISAVLLLIIKYSPVRGALGTCSAAAAAAATQLQRHYDSSGDYLGKYWNLVKQNICDGRRHYNV